MTIDEQIEAKIREKAAKCWPDPIASARQREYFISAAMYGFELASELLLNSDKNQERSVATEYASSTDAEAHHHLQLIHQEVIKEQEELKQELDNLKNNQ
jgi:hypothetical protein